MPVRSVLLFLILCSVKAQTVPTFYFSPIAVGKNGATIPIYIPGPTVNNPPPIEVLWNGTPRTLKADESAFNPERYIFVATAADLAQPGLAEITVRNAVTHSLIGTGMLSVAYDISAVSVVVDSSRSRLYVSTPAQTTNPKFPPNSVVTLDPATGIFGPVYSAGALTGQLTLSADGSNLYVIVEGTGKVVRLDSQTMTPLSEFAFRIGTPFPGYPASLAIFPNKAGSVAMSLRSATPNLAATVAVFDNGVKRPGELSVSDGYDTTLVSPDGKYFFLGAAGTSGSGLRYAISAAGFASQEPLTITGGGPVAIQDNLLYTTHGAIVEVETGELAGNLNLTGGLAFDAERKRILSVYGLPVGGFPLTGFALQAFDAPTQTPLGYFNFLPTSSSNISYNSSVRLLRFGADGLVYLAPDYLHVFHTPLAGPAPTTSSGAIVGAATSAPGAISPGQILSIYGANLGSFGVVVAATDAVGKLPSDLAHTQVWFDRRPGTLLFTSAGQVNVIAPFALEPGSDVRVQVWNYGIPSGQAVLHVQSAQPGLFTRNGAGTGPVSVINQDGTVNTPSPVGSIIALYGSGGGRTATAKDGEVVTVADLLLGSTQVLIGGKEARVVYAGAAPSLVHGAVQINVEVPAGLASNSTVPVVLRINGYENLQGATLEIR